jgi:acetyl esterase/lipase
LLYPESHPASAGENPPRDPNNHVIVVKTRPEIVPFLPERPAASRAAVVICPGGGYSVLAIDHEGTDVARWFAERGVAAFVLKYRCGGGDNRYPVPQSDAKRAMQLVRSRAGEWNIDPQKVGIMGFSAGGHLASSLTVLGDGVVEKSDDPLEEFTCRPDFAVLVYPVLSMLPGDSHGGSRNNLIGGDASPELSQRLSSQLQVDAQTPPTFFVHAADDRAVPLRGVLQFAAALDKQQIPFELHVLPRGGHGFGFRKTDGRYLRDWPTLLAAWLVDQGLADQGLADRVE